MSPLDPNREDPVPPSAPASAPQTEAPPLAPEATPPAEVGMARRLAEKEARKAGKRAKKESDKERKKKSKDHKAAETARKSLDPREQYKALVDALKETQDLVDLADHKTRFALIIMGALNAAIFIVTTRSNAMGELPPGFRPWALLYLAVYIPVAVFFLYQAIETLRPRRILDTAAQPATPSDSEVVGLRFFADVLRRPLPQFVKAWNEVRLSQVNNEVAGQLYAVSKINQAKYAAVTRLYQGLKIITMLTVTLVVVAGYYALGPPEAGQRVEAGVGDPAKGKGGKPKKAAKVELLPEPQRFPISAVREPSGVTFFPPSLSLYVIGDEGSLARVDLQGNVLASFPVKGNLEDVAFHSPSGKLVILNEKKGELLVTDPQTGTVTGRFKLDAAALLGDQAAGKNEGFEGLAFRAVPGERGGGVFYLVHQRDPAALLSIAFDLSGAEGTIGASAKRGLRELQGRDDLTAVTVMPGGERLAIIAHHRVIVTDLEGAEEMDFPLPGSHQEGIAFDAAGSLWIAQDRSPDPKPSVIDHSGLLIYKGVLETIEKELAKRSQDDASGGKS